MEDNQQLMALPEMMVTLRLRPMVGSAVLSVEPDRSRGFQLQVALSNIVGGWGEAISILTKGIEMCVVELRKELRQPASSLGLPDGFILPLLPGSRD